VSVTCTAENGADCKQSIDPVELDAGVAIPTLPSGASVAIAVIAQVTYRGQDSSGESYPAIVVGAVTAPTGTPDPNPANNSVRQANSVVPRAGSGGGAADLYTLVETQPSSPLTYWPSPGVAKYVVTVWNSGTAAADGAVLMVPRSGGLSKTSLSCSGVNGAVCPTNLTVNQIEEGVVIPKLPARDGHVRVTFEADVTAPLGSSVSVTSYVTAPLGSGDRFSNDNTDTKSNRILLTSTDLDLTRVPASGVRGLQTVVPNAAPTLSAASCTLAGPTLNPPTVWPGGVVLSWAHINGATYTVSSTDFGVVTPSPVTSATYPATVSVSHSAPLHNPTQYEYAVVAEYGKGCGISRVSVTPPRPFVAIAEANRSDAYDVRLTWHIPDGVDSAMPAEGHDDPGFFQTISGSTYRMKAWETWELGIANVPAGEQTWLIVPYWETPLGRSIDASSGARVTFKRP
jgi:hypothetical protein